MSVRFAYGFEIKRNARGFYLLDRDEFNNWGEVGADDPFPTSDAAAEYALMCDKLKKGGTPASHPAPAPQPGEYVLRRRATGEVLKRFPCNREGVEAAIMEALSIWANAPMDGELEIYDTEKQRLFGVVGYDSITVAEVADDGTIQLEIDTRAAMEARRARVFNFLLSAFLAASLIFMFWRR